MTMAGRIKTARQLRSLVLPAASANGPPLMMVCKTECCEDNEIHCNDLPCMALLRARSFLEARSGEKKCYADRLNCLDIFSSIQTSFTHSSTAYTPEVPKQFII